MEKLLSTERFTDFTGPNLSELAQFGKVYLFETVSSTQDIAKKLVSKQEPALVIALNQTKGRGRFLRRWHSVHGGLYFSYLLFPDFSVKDKTAQMTMLISLAVAQTLESLSGQKIDLRWPNDIMISGKKLGGLLCEAKQNALIIGVGINLNQPFFPAFLSDATSLFIETNQNYELDKVLRLILTRCTNLYQEFNTGKFAQFLPEIKSRHILLNQRVRADLWLRRIEGNVLDLDDDGRLLIRTDSGRLLTITAGKVHRIKSV
ncbi:MAG: biotin--[acetyl-CoA-carboxylase] ligase [bacterium]